MHAILDKNTVSSFGLFVSYKENLGLACLGYGYPKHSTHLISFVTYEIGPIS
jgi:hypothetical protein